MIGHKTLFTILICFLLIFWSSNFAVGDAWSFAGEVEWSSAFEDEWSLPQTETYLSPNKKYYFEVFPKILEAQLKHFKDKVQIRENAGFPEAITSDCCKGSLYTFGEDGNYQSVWSIRLINDVAPVKAIVSNSGNYVATFDNWLVESGKDVVHLYGPEGKFIRKYSLEDIMTPEEVEEITHSVGSRYEAGDHYFDEENGTLNLKVVKEVRPVGMRMLDREVHRQVRIDLKTGSVIELGNQRHSIQHVNLGFAEAVLDGDIAAVRQSLASGADPNIPIMKSKTALISAAELGYLAVVKILTEAGADVNPKDADGNTALIYLSEPLMYLPVRAILHLPGMPTDFEQLYQSTIQVLLDKGADPNTKNYEGMTALLYVVRTGGTRVKDTLGHNILLAMLRAGADVNLRHHYGKTPLMYAAESGYDDSARALLDSGADVNLKDDRGRTALMYAAGNGRIKILRSLLPLGADLNGKDYEGWTALKIAKANNNMSIVYLLKKAGAIE